jgi:hypothetical protein
VNVPGIKHARGSDVEISRGANTSVAGVDRAIRRVGGALCIAFEATSEHTDVATLLRLERARGEQEVVLIFAGAEERFDRREAAIVIAESGFHRIRTIASGITQSEIENF